MANVTECRICRGSRFLPVLDLGATPFADDFLTEDRLDQPEAHMPLKVVLCEACLLMQLTYVSSRESLYQSDYPYVSSTTYTGVQHYHDMAQGIVDRFKPKIGSLVIDIGSNVGVLAEGFQKLGMRVLGVEPAPKIARTANLRGIETISEFFTEDLACAIARSARLGRASMITGTNVVAHIDDLHDLFRGLRLLLDEKGVFVFEAPYLGDLLDNLEYDTVYHEHLSYFSIRPIQFLCDLFDFELIDVERMRIHGGTLRYYIAFRNAHKVNDRVLRMSEEEGAVYDRQDLAEFAVAVERHRRDLTWMLYDLRHRGKSICAVSAPAKGMTLLNYCGIGRGLLDFVTEKAPLKLGKFTPGTHLPVVPDGELLARQPDYALLLAWNFADEIMANQKGYAGKFIVPIPEPRVVG